MKVLIDVLHRCLTKEFYVANAMFFLLTIGLVAGFMRANEHIALATFFISAPVWTLIPAGFWIAYAYKINSFNHQECSEKSMRFVHEISLLPTSIQILCTLSVAYAQFVPAITYGLFLVLIAIKNGQVLSAVSVVIALITITGTLTILLYRQLGYVQSEAKVSLLKRWFDRKFSKSFIQFFIEWLVRHKTGMVLVTKIFGCLMLFAICQLYRYDTYDYRLLAMGCLIAFGASLAFVFQFVLFENHLFTLMRHLPLSLSLRMIYFIISLGILCLPEITVLTRNFPEQLPIHLLPELIVFCLALFILGYRVLLSKINGFEAFSGKAFLGFMILFVIILFSVPVWFISIALILMAAYRYERAFYEFEFIIRENQDLD
ncbi:MAG: hypothetical protein HOP08_03785 [Cyclobacteriaceae bacterium]|nr:hypothetical protein [Cyclobacteriaceae bacterium]